MTLTREDVQAWLDRYAAAWRTYQPDAISDLFSEDAEYRYHPWDEPVRGRAAILNDWVEPGGDASRRDAPGTYDGHYEPWAIDGDRAVAVGVSRYWTDASRATLERTYHNCFLLRFDGDGRCAEFTEFYVKEQRA
jgi:hypothetical protein